MRLLSTSSSSEWTPLGRGSGGRFGLRRFRAKLNPTAFGTHRAITHALPPSFGLVRDRLSCEPLSGHLFLFCNGQRNRLKVLVWDGSGLWVCAKRLEKGRFTWPQSGDAQGKVLLSHEELSLLLGGIDLAKTKHKRWYRKVSPDGHAAA